MNKKGKNKKGKVPNPIPSQQEKSGDKVEESGKATDKIEDVGMTTSDRKEEVGIIGEFIQNLEEKVESVKEERVPEIVSEIITPLVDIKDEETPIKPKRNRGKKKKGKDDEFDVNLDEKVPAEETKVNIPENKSKLEELPPVTPTARKKKNKKKDTEQEQILDQELSNILTEAEMKEPEKKESALGSKQEFLKTEMMDPEIKTSKKKKNKKKRNDSERSDKDEFSCTAAFQKILDDKDEPSEIKMEEKIGDSIITIESVKTEIDFAKIKVEQTEENIQKASTPRKGEEEIKETPTGESKGKKKNKKDKKQTLKLEEIPKKDELRTEQTPLLIEFETPVQSVIGEQPKEVPLSSQEREIKEISVSESLQPLVKDLSPKSKAKIAKPVEKKRKGKHDIQTFESMSQDIISTPEPLKVKEEPLPIELENVEIKITEQKKASDIESQTTQVEIPSDITFATPDEDEKLIAQEFELFAEKAMGKKRKKASKMPKALDIDSGIQELKLETEIKQTEIKEEINKQQFAVETEILTPQTDQQDFIIMSQKSDIPIAVDTVTETKQSPKLIEQTEFKGKVLLTPENVVDEKEFTKDEETSVQKAGEKQKTETKPSKKRKKSPKQTEVVVEVVERAVTPKLVEMSQETSESEEITQQSLAEKIDASNITRMYDIDISSIKADEAEGSISDAIPDITYPRASSQQLIDDNNNTVITEILTPEELIIDTPLRQECTHTSKKTEEREFSPKEEKTDVKSKMMEVNQDMEELRLSIERSLAELTSIEKSEETIEKEFEATRMKAKNVSSLLFGTPISAVVPVMIEKTNTGETVDKSLEDVKMSTLTEDKQQFNDKPQVLTKEKSPIGDLEENQAFTKEKTPIGDKSKKTPKKEKKIELSYDESKTTGAPYSTDGKIIETPPVIEDKPVHITPAAEVLGNYKPLNEEQKIIQCFLPPIALPPVEEKQTEILDSKKKDVESKPKEQIAELTTDVPPVCPARKDNKGKHKKKKGKQDTQQASTTQSTTTTSQSQTTHETKKDEKKESKTESKSDSKSKSQSTEKGKQQASNVDSETQEDAFSDIDYEPIENFEDALTSSADDVNKTFEMIVKESQEQNNPKINIIAPEEEKTPVSPPKNLLGHPDIPVRSNRRDFKKEKDKIPNEVTARVKIKDSVEVERKQSKNTQTINKMKEFSKDYKMDDNDDFVYKYSFRKVFLQSSCHVCKKVLSGSRVPCCYCNLLFYCSNKHKDEDWPQHQALCFAVSTIVHLKDQKHIYADAKNLTGHDYRLIRMQMIVSCEKVLKRRLVPWEQEALLYPRVCAHVPCREWRQNKLSDCQGCGQISFCTDNADHVPKSHSRWCKSYSLYEKLVCYQQTKGRLEPKMPTKVLQEQQQIPEKINEVLASMYEEKIDITDIQYAALTQLATAPLTAAYCHQLCRDKAVSPANGVNKKLSSLTIHVVGAELQFEADALNKWEVFFLHLRPDLQKLRVVLINYNLNPSNLPLELLGKIKLCENCRQNKRSVVFSFQDKRTYTEYKSSEDFMFPDLVCAFNPSIQRTSVYNGKDPWPSAINAILKLKVLFIITAYTITELHKDCIRIKECSETGYNVIAEPKYNNFASVRPDRNFISDDEMPLLFKNYCFSIISG